MNIQVAQIKAKSLWKYDLNLQKIIYSQRAINFCKNRKNQFGKPKHQTN
jgi:hypothetical protein